MSAESPVSEFVVRTEGDDLSGDVDEIVDSVLRLFRRVSAYLHHAMIALCHDI